MSDTMRRLREDHRNLTHLLDLFEQQLGRLEAGGEPPNYELLHAILDYLLDYPDLEHHPREDVVYRILQERQPETATGIGDLLRDHREIADLARRFLEGIERVLSELDVPRDRLAALGHEFLRRYRGHIRREDREFFPAADQHLRPEDWDTVDSEFALQNDPLFGPAVEKRFATLRLEIDEMAGE